MANRERLLKFIVLAAAAFSGVLPTMAAESATEAALPSLAGASVTDLTGRVHSLAGKGAPRLTVMVFLGVECPVSNGYCPALQRLADAYASQGVTFLGVHCDPDVSADRASRHANEFSLRFPLALDHQQQLAGACGARIMPTAVVVRQDGQVIYRGRVDNRYALTGARKPEATVFDLRSAIDAGLADRLPEVAVTKAFGCPLPIRRRAADSR
ncbi:MAG: redoxin family protein [Planctomycetes bacterium]|nr:redoxin family protein [Planctomycetota bacterium]